MHCYSKSIVRTVTRMWESVYAYTSSNTDLQRRASRLSVSSRRSFGGSPPASPIPLQNMYPHQFGQKDTASSRHSSQDGATIGAG
jgi:hypothetical protein